MPYRLLVLCALLSFAIAAGTPSASLAASEEGLRGSPAAAEGLVNVNTASSSELQTLPGIGPAKADAIIAYRTTNGAFATVDDLMKVKGIGAKTLEKLRPLVTVGNGAPPAPPERPAEP